MHACARVLLAGSLQMTLYGTDDARAQVDNFISRHVLEKRVRALVAVPNLSEQEVPYMNGDVVHSSLQGCTAKRASKKPKG